jgi:adenosyl cobinamide kinase/adenosyl cobinamide phosphate guanylyltransferase
MIGMSATEKMKKLVAKYIEERNWIMLDCLNVWLHNRSGATARSKFPDLVLDGMKKDFL